MLIENISESCPQKALAQEDWHDDYKRIIMYYVYIIKSTTYPDQIYVGCTENLDKRLSNHNAGTTQHTEKYKPWKLIMYLAFQDRTKAYEFEEYLKSGSGRAFRDKRLL